MTPGQRGAFVHLRCLNGDPNPLRWLNALHVVEIDDKDDDTAWVTMSNDVTYLVSKYDRDRIINAAGGVY